MTIVGHISSKIIDKLSKHHFDCKSFSFSFSINLYHFFLWHCLHNVRSLHYYYRLPDNFIHLFDFLKCKYREYSLFKNYLNAQEVFATVKKFQNIILHFPQYFTQFARVCSSRALPLTHTHTPHTPRILTRFFT